jgi:hypothetical protein
LSTLDYILIRGYGESERASVQTQRRRGLWQDAVLKGLDAAVEFEKLGISLTLRDIYEGLQFRPKPKLLEPPREDYEPTAGFKPN